MAKVLLAGESWISAVDDHKGYDVFPHTQVHIGCAELLAALEAEGHEVTHLRSHDVAVDFPDSLEKLDAYDVVILSDVGANTLLLPPQVFEQGLRAPNRLKVLRDWVHAGGGLMMAGGYLSFQGFQAKANYHDTPIEDVLPVTILPYDDRVEAPEGAEGVVTDVDHPIPGQVVVGIKTADVDAAAKAIEEAGGGIVKGPYDDAHERRAVVYDNKGNGIVFYSPLNR